MKKVSVKIQLKIQQIRKQRKMTQEALAREAGLSHSWVTQVERKPHSSITLKNLVAVAESLDVKPEELWDYEIVSSER